jgi:hypothetical protein
VAVFLPSLHAFFITHAWAEQKKMLRPERALIYPQHGFEILRRKFMNKIEEGFKHYKNNNPAKAKVCWEEVSDDEGMDMIDRQNVTRNLVQFSGRLGYSPDEFYTRLNRLADFNCPWGQIVLGALLCGVDSRLWSDVYGSEVFAEKYSNPQGGLLLMESGMERYERGEGFDGALTIHIFDYLTAADAFWERRYDSGSLISGGTGRCINNAKAAYAKALELAEKMAITDPTARELINACETALANMNTLA